MKAWEKALEMLQAGIPGEFEENNEELWIEQSFGPEQSQDDMVKIWWHSKVPGSRAEESICLSAIQATENKGYLVPEGMRLYEEGCKALEKNDMAEVHRITYELFQACYEAQKDETNPYWQSKEYRSFQEYAREIVFPKESVIWDSLTEEEMKDRMYGGWLAQIVGGAYGTCLEGYTTDAIMAQYGEVKEYIRKPNTYNDDITYELALLSAYKEHGVKTSARDIAFQWLARIPSGWSAEAWALNNLRCGMMPPESGEYHNPFNEWIGAQMRGAICGQIYPGNPYEAARSAWMDGSISHKGNGILGEVFNAILVSKAFVEKDMRKLLEESISLIPSDSEYGKTIRFAMETCKASEDYYSAWRICEERYRRYNWIHAYPNACIEVIALYFGNDDFENTLMICGVCGQDADCNAAQVMSVLGTAYGSQVIPEYWSQPFGDRLDTTIRGMKVLSIRKLAEETLQVAKELRNSINLDMEKMMIENTWDSFEFRMVKEEETEELARIEAICFPPEEACTLSIMKERIHVAGDCFLIAKDLKENRIAGFINGLCSNDYNLKDEIYTDASLHDPKGENIMICGVDVLPDCRNRGLARKMMQEFLISQKQIGRKQAILTCVPGKVSMYEKFGYTDCGESESTWGGEKWHEMKCIL